MDDGHPVNDDELDRMRHDQRRLMLAIETHHGVGDVPPLRVEPGLEPLVELGLRSFADGLCDKSLRRDLERALPARCAEATSKAVRATAHDVKHSRVTELLEAEVDEFAREARDHRTVLNDEQVRRVERLWVVLQWADQLADDAYADPRLPSPP